MYEKKWDPPKEHLKYFENTKPLIDNTHTPRSREKAISLERNFCSKKWIPPKNAMGEFVIKKKKIF